MTLTLEITPEQQARLEAAARRQGTSLDRAALKLIDTLPPATDAALGETDPTLRLFAEWKREDAAMTPEEIAEVRREAEEFMANINAERLRAGSLPVY